MRKILVFLESFSIGDTVAAIPYVDKFQEVNSEDEITISINDWLIPYFSTIYTNLKFIGKNTDYIFDKVIDLKYDYSKYFIKMILTSIIHIFIMVIIIYLFVITT